MLRVNHLQALSTPTPVVLGGGTLQNGQVLVHDHIRARMADQAPLALPRVLDVQPVAGAVAEALMEADASDAARHRVWQAIAAGPPHPHDGTRAGPSSETRPSRTGPSRSEDFVTFRPWW
jgi:hypothetical protein